ncbi:MAG: hypothetical protein H6765_00085 [Candidatus Peribacteria bacterium]|nr:MAG: hypothetical protein H6765_00085 [Candidatus Peribacteria bacterium]
MSGSNDTLHALSNELLDHQARLRLDELKSSKIRTPNNYFSCAQQRLETFFGYLDGQQVHVRTQAFAFANQYSLPKWYLQ